MITSIEDCKNKLISYLKGHEEKVDVISVLGGEMIIGSIQALKELGSEERIKVIGIAAFMPVIKLMKEDEPVIACVLGASDGISERMRLKLYFKLIITTAFGKGRGDRVNIALV